MLLFFNAVSRNGYISLYEEKDKILISEEYFSIAGNESTKAVEVIDNFLKKNSTLYDAISNIMVVVGPGSFTGVRTISLVVNTLAFSYPNTCLTPINFFDLYSNYPIVKSSSKRDIFVKYSKNDIIQVESNDVFIQNIKQGQIIYGDMEVERFKAEFEIESTIDYNSVIQTLELQSNKRVAPLYIKKPNIS